MVSLLLVWHMIHYMETANNVHNIMLLKPFLVQVMIIYTSTSSFVMEYEGMVSVSE